MARFTSVVASDNRKDKTSLMKSVDSSNVYFNSDLICNYLVSQIINF